MTLLGVGSCRKVYSIDDYTVKKIPYNQNGFIQAHSEWLKWNVEAYKPYLATIYSYDQKTGIIIAERLFDCHYLKNPDSRWREICKRDQIQVGYSKDGILKMFDYGESDDLTRTEFSAEQKTEIKKYALPRR